MQRRKGHSNEDLAQSEMNKTFKDSIRKEAVANGLTLKPEIIPGYPGGRSITPRSHVRVTQPREDSTSHAGFEDRRGMGQWLQVGKIKIRTDSLPEPQEEPCRALPCALMVSLAQTIFGPQI